MSQIIINKKNDLVKEKLVYLFLLFGIKIATKTQGQNFKLLSNVSAREHLRV